MQREEALRLPLRLFASKASTSTPATMTTVEYDQAEHHEHEHRYLIASFVCALAIVAVSFVGLLGNILSFYIFTRREMRLTSINVLLSGLAVFDGLVCLLGAPAFATLGICALLPQDANCDHATAIVTVIIYPFAMMAQTCSIWCLILITVERFIAVCFPLQTKQWCTSTRSKLMLVAISVCSFLYNFVRFFEYSFAVEPDGGPHFVSWLRGEELYDKYYLLWLNFVTHFIVPMLLLLSLNSFIVCSLRRKLYISLHVRRYTMPTARKKSSNGGGGSSNGRPPQLTLSPPNDNSTTWMMVFVTCLFVVCNVSSFCLNAIEALGYLDAIDPELFAVISDVNNLLAEVNSAANCFIYYKFSGRYRRQCASLVSRRSDTSLVRRSPSKLPSCRSKQESPSNIANPFCNGNSSATKNEVTVGERVDEAPPQVHTWLLFPSVRLSSNATEVML